MKQQPVIICEDVMTKDLRQLATVTILQALEDAKKAGKIEQRLDAVLWLTGPDAPWWCEWAGMPFADVWKMLVSGSAKKPNRRKNGYGRQQHSETF